jgi:DNA invertase Pin-like site-specific DNA recombinase
MNVGYSRTSTVEQLAGLEAQERNLKASGIEKLFTEQVSSVAKRPQLEAALDYLREGDTLIVTKIDRLARSTADLLRIAERVKAKCAGLLVLSPRLEMNAAAGPFGELIFTMIGAVAAFERSLMLERQREGIAKAKGEGKYKGRPAEIDAAKVKALRAEGVGATEIAKRLGIGRASVYRALEAA